MSFKCLQSRQPLLPQPVLRQHTANRLRQDLATSPLSHHAVHVDLFQRPGAGGMCAVEFLESLLARCVKIDTVGGHHVVTAVGRGVENGLVLAHEDQRNRGGDAPEGSWIGADINVVP